MDKQTINEWLKEWDKKGVDIFSGEYHVQMLLDFYNDLFRSATNNIYTPKQKTMNKKITLLVRPMPDVINYSIEGESPAQRQDGFKLANNVIKVADLTTEEAEEYGELLKQEFIQHHKTLQLQIAADNTNFKAQ